VATNSEIRSRKGQPELNSRKLYGKWNDVAVDQKDHGKHRELPLHRANNHKEDSTQLGRRDSNS